MRNMSLFSLFRAVSILSSSFYEEYTFCIIIIDTFLFKLSSVLSMSIMILLKIELDLISFLRVKIRLSAMKRETPPPVLFGLILYS